MYNPNVIVAAGLGIILLIILWSKFSDEASNIRTFADFVAWIIQVSGWVVSLGIVFIILHLSLKYWSVIETP
jgi:hypothetical protein